MFSTNAREKISLCKLGEEEDWGEEGREGKYKPKADPVYRWQESQWQTPVYSGSSLSMS